MTFDPISLDKYKPLFVVVELIVTRVNNGYLKLTDLLSLADFKRLLKYLEHNMADKQLSMHLILFFLSPNVVCPVAGFVLYFPPGCAALLARAPSQNRFLIAMCSTWMNKG